MIHGVFGKLGSGKGLLVMDIIAKELIDGFRDIVTNVPVRIVPWVNGQGIPQIGLKAYLLEKLSPLSEDEVDEILKRVKVIEDIDKGFDLFLWRRDGETGEWFKLDITKNDEKGRPERFNAEQIKQRHAAPVLCVTDEAWQFYPNNGGWSRAPVLAFYSRQQRKLRDEWYIVTQHPNDVDAVLWNIAQDFWVCRNHGMERMGVFRQPSMFRVIVYLTNPAKGNAIRSHEFYRRLDKKLSQCYDTTAGVGIGGGFKGDSNQKRAGLHIGWLVLAIVLVVAVLAAIPFGLRKMTSPFLTRTLSGGRQPAATNAPARPVARPVPAAERPAGSVSTAVESQGTNLLTCSGYKLPAFGIGPEAYLSDGTTVEPPELQRIEKHSVVVNGRHIPIVKQKNDYSVPVVSAPDFYPSYPQTFVSRSPAPSVDVTVIGQNRRQKQPVRSGVAQQTGHRFGPMAGETTLSN